MECPILQMKGADKKKTDICVSCPIIRLCFEDIPWLAKKQKLKVFLEEVKGMLREIEEIEDYIIKCIKNLREEK